MKISEDITEYLTIQYNGATPIEKEVIRELLQLRVINLCKCPICHETFDPRENIKTRTTLN